MPDSLTSEQFRALVAKKNAEVDKKKKKPTSVAKRSVHSTEDSFKLEKVDKFMADMEPVLRKHFTGIVQEEIDRDTIEVRTNERYIVKIEIKKV